MQGRLGTYQPRFVEQISSAVVELEREEVLREEALAEAVGAKAELVVAMVARL